MTPSSPETVARSWAPAEFAPSTRPTGSADDAPRAEGLFELAAAADIPETLLAPARLAAESAGWSAGWNAGMAAAAATAEQEREQRAAQDRQARELATAQVSAAVTALRDAAHDLASRDAAVARDLEQLVLDTAFQIAEALVGAHLADDAERGAAALGRVLALAPPDAPVTVRLNRADHAIVSALPSLPERVTLVADATLQPGDARAGVGATTIDARLSAALERVRRTLQGRQS